MPYIVGLGVACDIARGTLPNYKQKVKRLRDKLHAKIEAGLGKDMVWLNGHPEQRLPNTLNLSLRSKVGEELLSRIPEVATATGAACHAGATEPSSVLLEIGMSRELALGALRLTLGRWSTEEEVNLAAELIVEQVKRLAMV